MFRHNELDLFLVVYVDDFKMSGPAQNLAAGWALISKLIKKMEEPRLKRYLECDKEPPDLRFGPFLRTSLNQ